MSLKKKIRKLIHKSVILNNFYEKLSFFKTIKNSKLDDISFFKKRYKQNMGKKLNLDFPETFNEKLIWLQLNDRNPRYTDLADKIKAKKIVADLIGTKYVVPLIGTWLNAKEITFEKLPKEYVLKCNHDCGTIFIKRESTKVNKKKIVKKFNAALKRNYYDVGRVWSYKNIRPMIFAEKLIETRDGKVPKDYKIFCFYGQPKFVFVASDRDTGTKFDFYDIDWNRLDVKQYYSNSGNLIGKPTNWEEMLELAKVLSKEIPHVRVDFYENNKNEILFGEMTFCHFSGKEPFTPDSWDKVFGSYVDLEKVKIRK